MSKFAIDPEHRRFFQSQQAIEFHGLVDAAQLSAAVDNALCKRLECSPEDLARTPSEKIFLAGRDLWRDNEALRKIVLSPSLAETAVNLTDQHGLRIGYSMLLPIPSQAKISGSGSGAYSSFLVQKCSLQERSCFQGVVCGLILCLNELPGQPAAEQILLPHKKGNGVFIGPQLTLPLSQIYDRPGQRYLLITYVQSQATYINQPLDPHVYFAKQQLGYAFNETLRQKHHPIVCP